MLNRTFFRIMAMDERISIQSLGSLATCTNSNSSFSLNCWILKMKLFEALWRMYCTAENIIQTCFGMFFKHSFSTIPLAPHNICFLSLNSGEVKSLYLPYSKCFPVLKVVRICNLFVPFIRCLELILIPTVGSREYECFYLWSLYLHSNNSMRQVKTEKD